MVTPVLFFCFFLLFINILGSKNQNTVSGTVNSVYGMCRVGALGHYTKRGIKLFPFEFEIFFSELEVF